MSILPAMPMFTDALLADTSDLEPDEFGAYLRILLTTWEKGCRWFPDDDRVLSRITGIPRRLWRQRVRGSLLQFFDLSGGQWLQKRLLWEWNQTLENRNQKAAAGRASAEAKRLKKQNTTSTAVDEPLPTAEATARQRLVNSSSSTSLRRKKVRKKEIPPLPPLRDGEQPKPDEPDPSPAVTSPMTGEGEAPQPGDKPPKPPPPDHAPEMFAIWRERFGAGWPKLTLDDKRAKTLNTRLRDSFGKDIANWIAYCDLVRQNPFLTGKMPGKPWRANLDWITGPKHIQDIREGKYDYELAEGYPTHANGSATRRIPHETLLTGFAEAARDHRNKAKV